MTIQERTIRAPGHGRVSRRRSPGKDGHKELLDLLIEPDVPGKDEIIRVKALIRELAGRRDVVRPRPDEAQGFISAYFDLYLARISGDHAYQRAGLARCLSYLGPEPG